MSSSGEFAVEVTRAGVPESRHRIHAVVADRSGPVAWWDGRDRPTIPRSAIKTIQALPLVRSGAALAHGVSREELALACASHSAEDAHVEAVTAWLHRLGLTEADLECGADRPLGATARRRWIRAGAVKRPVLNGCSGKHTGFLTVARHLGLPTAGYVRRESSVQREVTAAIETLTTVPLGEAPVGIDGCGIPVYALPLWRWAHALARLVDPVDLPDDWARAAGPVVEAAQLGFWVSGTGRTEVVVGEAATEPVVIKGGAEGVYLCGLPRRGLGLAVKAEDGTPRASQAAVRGILRHLEVLPADAGAGGPSPVTNKSGTTVGEVRVVLGRPDGRPGG